ncbi:MAG: coproporphyrinogen dehydrogenase HemZ [Firmicutes bacterium]|nr:coproporphyrinogen dehydrogenase HemZ [Bacillota bacterium]
MYRIKVATEKDKYELGELTKMFLPASAFEMTFEDSAVGPFDLTIAEDGSKDDRKRLLYGFLKEQTGKDLDWGILTGVRPGKLYNDLFRSLGREEAERRLRSDYYVSPEKLHLLSQVHFVQEELFMDRDPHAVGIYVGIPFCPTRCSYCSFTSNPIKGDAAIRYLNALLTEIEAVACIMKEQGLYAESVYIGGGTPTSLIDSEFEKLLQAVASSFITEKTREFSVEAGRPDTITEAKLALIRKYGAGRISINPQSMKQHTLDLIGRSHTPEEILQAFGLAKQAGIPIINADLITGLPEEEPEDFKNTLDQVIALDPENITVHTLAVKKGSRLIESDEEYNYKHGQVVAQMLSYAEAALTKAGYKPYYLYRQKHMAGNFENVGWCKNGTPSIYNIRIMEDDQTIIAMGAGAMTKVFYPNENRLERVPNVSNYEIYIERIQEMIQRKKDGIL